MQRTPVESSMLASVGYDPDQQILEIEFTHGGLYHYFEVPEEAYAGLMEADSHGSYFTANIRDVYRYAKLVKKRR